MGLHADRRAEAAAADDRDRATALRGPAARPADRGEGPLRGRGPAVDARVADLPRPGRRRRTSRSWRGCGRRARSSSARPTPPSWASARRPSTRSTAPPATPTTSAAPSAAAAAARPRRSRPDAADRRRQRLHGLAAQPGGVRQRAGLPPDRGHGRAARADRAARRAGSDGAHGRRRRPAARCDGRPPAARPSSTAPWRAPGSPGSATSADGWRPSPACWSWAGAPPTSSPGWAASSRSTCPRSTSTSCGTRSWCGAACTRWSSRRCTPTRPCARSSSRRSSGRSSTGWRSPRSTSAGPPPCGSAGSRPSARCSSGSTPCSRPAPRCSRSPWRPRGPRSSTAGGWTPTTAGWRP